MEGLERTKCPSCSQTHERVQKGVEKEKVALEGVWVDLGGPGLLPHEIASTPLRIHGADWVEIKVEGVEIEGWPQHHLIGFQ